MSPPRASSPHHQGYRRAIAYLRDKGDMAIILVEQYFDFAKELADSFILMERGEVAVRGDRSGLDGG